MENKFDKKDKLINNSCLKNKMEISVNTKKLAEMDLLKLAEDGDNLYKVCSRYVGHLTKKASAVLEAKGYKIISTGTSNLDTGTYYYCHDVRGSASIVQFINFKDNDTSKLEVTSSALTIKVNKKDELVSLEAMLKSEHIPNKYIIVIKE